MRLEDARDIMNAWLKEVAHADFRYLSVDHVAMITGELEISLTRRWQITQPSRLNCPACGKRGFETKAIWSAVSDTAKLKCDKCGNWATVTGWDRKTKEATR